MRMLLALSLATWLAGAATAAPLPKDAKKTLAEKLEGEWRLVKTDAKNELTYEFTIHFKKEGKMEFHRQFPDREVDLSKGKYKVGEAEADKKYPDGSIDWTIGEGDESRGEISKILKINDDELVFEDPEGLKESFVRVKPKKKDKEKDK